MPDRYGNSNLDDDTEFIDYKRRAIAARRVGCRYCGAKPGHSCHNKITDQPTRKFLAHLIRITDAETLRHLPADADEELF
jgi:hypothetical protein